jgi:hypothetical protein
MRGMAPFCAVVRCSQHFALYFFLYPLVFNFYFISSIRFSVQTSPPPSPHTRAALIATFAEEEEALAELKVR